MKAAGILASTAKATSYNVLLQMTLRLMTFGLNAVIIRYISKDLLGVVNVRLTLLYSTILFVTKEAFERACLSRRDNQDWRLVINQLWCTVPIGAVVSVALSAVWLWVLENPDPRVVGSYGVGVAAFAGAAWLEILAQPVYVTAQAFLFVRLKVCSLAVSQAAKCVCTLVLVLAVPEWGVYSFAAAQLLSSLLYVASYYLYFLYYLANQPRQSDFPAASLGDFLPRVKQGQPIFDEHLLHLTWSFFKQSFLKQILTEGERYVMTFLNVLSFADQGVYDVINNLGSLVARFVFMPVEENVYLFFCQALERGKSAREQAQDSVTLCSRVLGVVLKLVTLVGLIVVVFGWPNAFLALHFYGGHFFTVGVGPTLLRCYCVYVLLLAVNGVSEAFVFASMSKQQVDGYNQRMVVFSVAFLSVSWLLTRQIGSVGFILANCLNMLLRIQHSLSFIKKYFEGSSLRPLSEWFPSKALIGALAASFLITCTSEVALVREGFVLGMLLHIVVSALCLLMVLLSLLYTENSMLQVLKNSVWHKNHTE